MVVIVLLQPHAKMHGVDASSDRRRRSRHCRKADQLMNLDESGRGRQVDHMEKEEVLLNQNLISKDGLATQGWR
jgi:hypothetical protein